MVGLKKFLSNKNTVTLICVIAGIAVLWYGYTERIRKQIQPVTVPYAKVQIRAGSLITEEMVGTISVPPAMLAGNPYRQTNDVVGKYAQADSIIPAGSLFYERSVVTKDRLPDGGILSDYPDDWVLYSLDVNITSTYGNSMVPGSYIDIKLQATHNDTKKIMVETLLKDVKILAVKDSSGNSVFNSNNESESTPSQLIFALPHDYWILLKKASYLRSYSTELLPVPTTTKDENVQVSIGSKDLEKFINSVTKQINSTD